MLPLFVPCANAKSGSGNNRDKFVPRPLPSTDRLLHLSAFEFVGQVRSLTRVRTVVNEPAVCQLLGLAMRSGSLLPLGEARF